nr:MAG TPA: hypothetical protein [Caudoviricetes sp.]
MRYNSYLKSSQSFLFAILNTYMRNILFFLRFSSFFFVFLRFSWFILPPLFL